VKELDTAAIRFPVGHLSETAMRSRHFGKIRHLGRTVVVNLVITAGVGFVVATFVVAGTTRGQAQTIPPPVITTNPSSSLTLPQQPETPVSPTTPGTLPGTTAANIGVGTNSITGAPCLGGGSSAVTGGIPGAPTAADQPAQPGQAVTGLPSNTSIYGLTNQIPNNTNPGAC
jgi:hypothetical protein